MVVSPLQYIVKYDSCDDAFLESHTPYYYKLKVLLFKLSEKHLSKNSLQQNHSILHFLLPNKMRGKTKRNDCLIKNEIPKELICNNTKLIQRNQYLKNNDIYNN